MKDYYTLQETADELGLSYGTVRLYVHYGKIKATKRGKNRLVAKAEIEGFKAKRFDRSTPS